MSVHDITEAAKAFHGVREEDKFMFEVLNVDDSSGNPHSMIPDPQVLLMRLPGFMQAQDRQGLQFVLRQYTEAYINTLHCKVGATEQAAEATLLLALLAQDAREGRAQLAKGSQDALGMLDEFIRGTPEVYRSGDQHEAAYEA